MNFPDRLRTALLLALFLALLPRAMPAVEDLKALHVHDRMMKQLGGDNWEAVATLGFDFVVRSGGVERMRRSHLWDRRTNEYRVQVGSDGRDCSVWFDLDAPSRGIAQCDGGSVTQAEADRLLDAAYRMFINDTWWVLMPFKWRDPGVQLTYIGTERSGKSKWDVVLLSFEGGTGLTSGDKYWAYVNRKTGQMDKWEMLLEGREGPPTPVQWTGWVERSGVSFSTVKEIEGSDRSIAIENLFTSRRRYPERFEPGAGTVTRLQSRPTRAPSPAEVVQPESRSQSPHAKEIRAAEAPEAPRPERARPSPPPPPAPQKDGVKTESLKPDIEMTRPWPNGRLIVLNKADNNAVLVDPSNMGILARVPTGQGPHEVEVSPDARQAYVGNYGHSQPGNTITVIDVSDEGLEVSATWDLGEYKRPHGLEFDAMGNLWVTAEAASSVIALDPSNGDVKHAAKTGQQVSHMIAINELVRKAFVANIGSGTVSVLPLRGGGEARQIEVGVGPEGIDVSPDGREVWVANRNEDEVVILDARRETVLDKLPTGDFPIRVEFSPDGRKVVISNVRGGDLWVYDARTRKQLRTIQAGTAPIGILIPPSGDRVFVADTRENMVRAFDLETGEKLGEVRTGNQPDGLGWVPGGGAR